MTLLTEDEARAKWCPMGDGAGADSCVASSCMAWRWHRRPKGHEKDWSGLGYCGLAGKPEGME